MPVKSCLSCPSFMDDQSEIAKFFDKSLGVPMCARFGRPMGTAQTTPNEQKAIAETFAAGCNQHGQPRPSTANWPKISLVVTTPDPDAMDSDTNPDRRPELVNSCLSCKHFIREDVVLSELGFPAGACARHGKLLLGHRLTLEAKACEERHFATAGARTHTSGMDWLPVYEDNFLGNNDPVRMYRRMMRSFVAPQEYETDRPVTDAESASGIRAWRIIEDFTSGKSVMYPIYRGDFFDDDERKKIPQAGDDEHPEDYVDHQGLVFECMVLWTHLDETPALWGQPGVGKTELFRHIAWLMQLPFERFSITGSSDVDDLSGSLRFGVLQDESGHALLNDEGKPIYGTYPQLGRVTKAWSKPCVLVIDEPNAGNAEIWQFLRPMTDNSKQLVLDWYDGREQDRHNDCYPALAMNPAWDTRNMGVHEVSDADANRLNHIFVQLPPKELEREILKTRCAHDGYELPSEILDKMMNIAEELRQTINNDELPITWGIRQQIKVARASVWFDLIKCYRMAIGDFLEPAISEAFLDHVRRHVEV